MSLITGERELLALVHDLSVADELRESFSVGQYRDTKYASNKETTVVSSSNTEAHKRDGETTDPKPETSGGDTKPGADGSDAKPG